MADLRARALAYLRSGAVRILAAAPAADARRANYVEAQIDGWRSSYLVRLTGGTWSCTCRKDDCPHIAIVALATGNPTAIRPGPTTHSRRLPKEL